MTSSSTPSTSIIVHKTATTNNGTYYTNRVICAQTLLEIALRWRMIKKNLSETGMAMNVVVYFHKFNWLHIIRQKSNIFPLHLHVHVDVITLNAPMVATECRNITRSASETAGAVTETHYGNANREWRKENERNGKGRNRFVWKPFLV